MEMVAAASLTMLYWLAVLGFAFYFGTWMVKGRSELFPLFKAVVVTVILTTLIGSVAGGLSALLSSDEWPVAAILGGMEALPVGAILSGYVGLQSWRRSRGLYRAPGNSMTPT